MKEIGGTLADQSQIYISFLFDKIRISQTIDWFILDSPSHQNEDSFFLSSGDGLIFLCLFWQPWIIGYERKELNPFSFDPDSSDMNIRQNLINN